MKPIRFGRAFIASFVCLIACGTASGQSRARVVHVFVALADNEHQGIVPVPKKLGNGSDPDHNLYWGAAFGVKTFFKLSSDWSLVSSARGIKPEVLERCVFKHRREDVYVVADAYRGEKIRQAVTDFLSAVAGVNAEKVTIRADSAAQPIPAGGDADVVAYVGHDAFMDFQIEPISGVQSKNHRQAIILACASKPYFSSYLKRTGAEPMLWTTGLMAPEAYKLKAALDGWILRESNEAIRTRAAQAYDKYQKCGLRAAQRLFTTGW